jgi:hypothetical protein
MDPILKTFKKLMLIFLIPGCLLAQKLNALDIVSKSIYAHDPNSGFAKFQGGFDYKIERDKQATRNFRLNFNKPKDIFEYIVNTDSVTFKQKIENGKCYLEANNKKKIPSDLIQKYDITCERTQYLEKVYNYLFGLPFKLNDPGVIIKDRFSEKIFNGKTRYEIAVEFDKNTGTDHWFFYFDKEDFLLSGYKFHHNDSPNSGEFIYLSDYEKIDEILMPKTKKWHWNPSGVHFRTDKLEKFIKK